MTAAKKEKIPEPLLTKATHAIELARLVLTDRAATGAVEDLAFVLMWMPDQELAKMHSRLAAVRTPRPQARRKR